MRTYLKTQAATHPDGAKSYYKPRTQNMTEGFGVVAYPGKYGRSGVHTFIVSHEGTVYKKDLGRRTYSAAMSIRGFGPDDTWQRVK